jgi:hypothetical protein
MWKRLEFLPHILKVIEVQDYPHIQLLVSDNGMNGSKVLDMVKAHYSRPYTFRQNPAIAEIPQHFNQLIEEATGEYFTLISDDDEVSPNFISELVGLLQRYPEASIAFARQEIMNGEGAVVRKSNIVPQTLMSGADFIRATWRDYIFEYEALGTNVARTAALRYAGSYPDFTRGTGMENAMIIKVCLNSHVALSADCVWRWRVYETSHGWSVPMKDLADASKDLMRFLETDEGIRQFGKAHPAKWKELKEILLHNEWQTYFWRWRDVYKPRLSYWKWIKAAFGMPFFLNYYRKVFSEIRSDLKKQIKKLFGRYTPPIGDVSYFERQ